MREPDVSPASRALDEILSSDSKLDQAIAKKIFAEVGEKAEGKKFHRTLLWRYRTGRSKPDVVIAGWLDEVTGGRVSAKGWGGKAAEATDVAH